MKRKAGYVEGGAECARPGQGQERSSFHGPRAAGLSAEFLPLVPQKTEEDSVAGGAHQAQTPQQLVPFQRPVRSPGFTRVAELCKRHVFM